MLSANYLSMGRHKTVVTPVPMHLSYHSLVLSHQYSNTASPFVISRVLIAGWPSLLRKLDESTARRQLKSPRSLSGRSIHLTLVTNWSRSWSWMTYCHTLCAMSIGPPILRYSYFKIWPWKSMKSQGHVWPSNFKGQGQTHWSHLRPGVQSKCLPFVLWQSNHFWLRTNSIFDLENSRSRSWPRSNLMVTSEALEFNRYVCFSFCGNRTIFGWDIANSIFDLEKSRSRSRRKWPKI